MVNLQSLRGSLNENNSNWIDSGSLDRFRKAQAEDKCIGLMVKWKSSEDPRPVWAEVSKYESVVMSYWPHWNSL